MVNEMTLRKNTGSPKGTHVKPAFADTWRQYMDEPLDSHPLRDLFYVVCLALDESAVTEDTCIIAGTTRTRTSFSLTLKMGGTPTTVYGATWQDLVTNIAELLT